MPIYISSIIIGFAAPFFTFATCVLIFGFSESSFMILASGRGFDILLYLLLASLTYLAAFVWFVLARGAALGNPRRCFYWGALTGGWAVLAYAAIMAIWDPNPHVIWGLHYTLALAVSMAANGIIAAILGSIPRWWRKRRSNEPAA